MPGAVVAIARRGKLAYYEAFGFSDAAAKTPMAKDAIFSLASMTKPLAAVATLMLAEQGDLLLNDPVGNYLPELKDMKVATATGTEPARRQPTLQDMLRHTGGVSYGNRGDTPLHKRYSAAVTSAATQSRSGVPAGAERAAALLSARHPVGIQLRARRGRPRRRERHEEAPRRVPAGTALHAARDGRHRLRRAGRPRRRGSPGRCRPIPTAAGRSPSACR